MPPGTPENLQPPAEPLNSGRVRMISSAEWPQAGKSGLRWRPAIGSALVAAMLAAVGTSIPIIPLALLCMFAAGGLAVTLYRRRQPVGAITIGMGAKLGLLAGGMGFGLLSLISSLRLFAGSERVELRQAFRDKMAEAMQGTADPDVQHALEGFRSYISTDHGLIMMVLFFLAIAAGFFLAFSALGGMLGAVLFGRESPRKQL